MPFAPSSPNREDPGDRRGFSPRRLVLAGLGTACVALAFVGIFVPGLPTTIFLIAASYLFTKSCPWLEERLVRSRWFAPYLPYLDRSTPMPRRARVVALALMWAAVATSLVLLETGKGERLALAATIVAAAVVGTVAILRIRRTPAREFGSGV